MPLDRPTLDTVAAAAGVSRMTVSNAYNRPDQLSAATRERILAVAAELGYSGPSPAGRSLRRGHAGTIGIVLTESLSYAFTDPGLVSFLRGVADELTEAGRAMLLVPTHAGRDDQLVRDAIVDAFVLCSLRDDDPAVAAVQARGVPVVTVGSPKLKGRPHIGIDNIAAAKLAADHLTGLGHRRLAVVGVPDTMPLDVQGPVVQSRRGFKLRVTGFVAAAAASGIDPGSIARCHRLEQLHRRGRGGRSDAPAGSAPSDGGVCSERRACPGRPRGRGRRGTRGACRPVRHRVRRHRRGSPESAVAHHDRSGPPRPGSMGRPHGPEPGRRDPAALLEEPTRSRGPLEHRLTGTSALSPRCASRARRSTEFVRSSPREALAEVRDVHDAQRRRRCSLAVSSDDIGAHARTIQ